MITNFRGRNLKIQHLTNILWPQWLKNSSTIFFLKIASNQCKSSKYWWEVWILGRGCSLGVLDKQKSYKCDNQLITWLTGITRPAGSCNLVTLKTNSAQYKNFVWFWIPWVLQVAKKTKRPQRWGMEYIYRVRHLILMHFRQTFFHELLTL